MTDDDLDRALFALPLEEPPADLHRRIMAATVLRADADVPDVGIVVARRRRSRWSAACRVWMFTSAPDAGTRLADSIVGVMRALGLFSRSNLRLAGHRNLLGVVDF